MAETAIQLKDTRLERKAMIKLKKIMKSWTITYSKKRASTL